MKKFYDTEIERLMILHYSRLSEKDQRHYAAIEAQKLGWGGKSYILSLFGLSSRTLFKGIAEILNERLYNQIPVGYQRRTGGGRKKICPKN